MNARIYRKAIVAVLFLFLFILTSCSSKSSTRVEQEFDEQGRLIKEIYFVQGEVFNSTVYQYGTDGNCSRENHYDAENALTYYITYEYNSIGQKIKQTQYQDNKMFTETTMEYNDKGLLSRSNNITWQGGKSYNLYFYDENDYMIEHKQYSVDSGGDTLRFWHKYENDNEGNIKEDVEYYSDGAVKLITKYEYYSNGNIKTIKEYDSNGNIKSTTEFDKSGNIK